MGTYGITKDDLIDEFREFLQNQQGDVSAIVIAKCWNQLAKEEKWDDNLKVINKFTKKELNP